MAYSSKAIQSVTVPIPQLKVSLEEAQFILDSCSDHYATDFLFEVTSDFISPDEKPPKTKIYTVDFMVQYHIKVPRL